MGNFGKTCGIKAMTNRRKLSKNSGEAVATKDGIQRAKGNLAPVLAEALEWINGYLIDNKEEILLCNGNLAAGSIEDQLVAIKAPSDVTDNKVVMPDRWHKTYTLCRSIPKYFIAHWLVLYTALSQTDVDRIDGFDTTCGLRKVSDAGQRAECRQ